MLVKSKEISSLRKTALELFKQGKLSEGIAELDKAFKADYGFYKDPYLGAIYHLFKARSLINKKSYSESVKQLGLVASFKTEFSDGPDFHVVMGRARLALGECEEALKEFDTCIRLSPSIANLYYLRGVTLQELRRNLESVESYNKAIDLNPKVDTFYLNKASVLMRVVRDSWSRGAKGDAYDLLVSEANRTPHLQDNYLYLHLRGVALLKLKKYSEASEDLIKSIQKKPDRWEPHFNLSNCYYRLGRIDQALAEIQIAKSLKPSEKMLKSIKDAEAMISSSSKQSKNSVLTSHHTIGNASSSGESNLEEIFAEIGGLDKEITEILNVIVPFFRQREKLLKLGIRPPHGILLSGPPGTGKTMMAKLIAKFLGFSFYTINGPEIVSKLVGGTEKALRDIFEEANAHAPSILFIDELDALVSARKQSSAADVNQSRLIGQLLTLMDGMDELSVLVLAATNRPNSLDEALRRPGRFDREIVIGIPTEAGRLDILQKITKNLNLSESVDLKTIASRTPGYVGADLTSLVREASMNAFSRSQVKDEHGLITEIDELLLRIEEEDFMAALKIVGPSHLRSLQVENPKVQWDQIGGLDETVSELKEAVELPMKHGDLLKKANVRAPKGILLYGPPGTGKTMLAKALATSVKANFIYVKATDIFSKWVGESEQNIHGIFEHARESKPCILFIDEIDSVARKRGGTDTSGVNDRVVNVFLTELDGFSESEGVTILGATNRIDVLDEALMRPGRFDRKIMVPLPDSEARLSIWKVHLRGKTLEDDITLEDLVASSEGLSGADIENVCSRVTISSIQQVLESSKEHEPTSEITISRESFYEWLPLLPRRDARN